jgi:acyl-[acyl carrier protein]--UDP-N-acetylglucosamine O-acyltransferase
MMLNKAIIINTPPKKYDKIKPFLMVAKDSLILRRLNLVGMKMRIYMERLKAVNIIELLRLLKSGKYKVAFADEQFKH